MGRKRTQKTPFQKVVSELFSIHRKRGGGIIKIEAWEGDEGEIVKYSMAYINHLIFSGDNGRVIGYDNTHSFHHRHYFGEISPVDDFKNYQDLMKRFEKEIKEFIK